MLGVPVQFIAIGVLVLGVTAWTALLVWVADRAGTRIEDND